MPARARRCRRCCDLGPDVDGGRARGGSSCAARRPRRLICDSIMKTIEVWPRPVFGPDERKRFGKPATVVPRYACGLPVPLLRQASGRRGRGSCRRSGCRSRGSPCRTRSCRPRAPSPSVVTIERGRTSRMPSVTTSTLGFVSAGYQSLLGQDALAADRELRRELAAQLGVPHLGVQVLAAPPARPACRSADGGTSARTSRAPSRSPARMSALGRGQPARRPRARCPMSGRPPCGITQGAVRWKTWSLPTRGWISGTNWIADAPVPMTATRSPARSWSWFQRAEWNVVPSNVVEAGDVRHGRLAEPALAGHEHVCRERALRASRSARRARPRPRPRPGPRCGSARAGGCRSARRDVEEVVEDLRLRGEGARPLRVRRERERVEVRRHVAAAAGIGVVVPGAAHLAVALEQDEVVARRRASA